MIILTSKELELIRESYINLSDNSSKIFENFYPIFFKLDPTAQTLFSKVDLKKQRHMLFESIFYFLNNEEITDEEIDEYVESLKNTHLSVHISASQFENFKKAFLMTIQNAYGNLYTEQIEQGWTKLITEVIKKFAEHTSNEE